MYRWLMMCVLGLSFSGCLAAQLDVNIQENHVQADGGRDSLFIPLRVQDMPIVKAMPNLCTQGQISFDLSPMGKAPLRNQMVDVFDAGSGLAFALVNHQTALPTQCGQDTYVAFYRVNHQASISANVPVNIHKSIPFTVQHQNQTEQHILNLNAQFQLDRQPETYTCQLKSNPNQTIHLGTIYAKDLEEKGVVQQGDAAVFQLDCNSAKTTVQTMVYDALNNGDLSKNILSNDVGADMAKGVGVQLLREDGQVVALSAKPAGWVEPVYDGSRWEISNQQNPQFKFRGQLVRTDKVEAGKVRAQAGVVFVYP